MKNEHGLTPQHGRFIEAYKACSTVDSACATSGLVMRAEPPLSGYYVYLLIDSRSDAIFYVGKGKGARAHEHGKLRSSDRSGAKVERIREILNQGAGLDVAIFAECGADESLAFQVERELISELREFGLTNISGGVVSSVDAMLARCRGILSRIVPRDRYVDAYPDRAIWYDWVVAQAEANILILEQRKSHGL